jgi:hypothetical protein
LIPRRLGEIRAAGSPSQGNQGASPSHKFFLAEPVFPGRCQNFNRKRLYIFSLLTPPFSLCNVSPLGEGFARLIQ